jgi:hypothetical protein
LNVVGGKIKNPFLTVGKNQLIWDSDLNPEGIAAQYGLALGEKTKAQINAGGFWVQENSTGVDTGLWGVQGYVTQTVCQSDTLLIGASYFDYGNIQGATDKYGILAGNTAGPDNTWASDYDLFELFAEYATEFGTLPLAIFGDWVKNTVAISDKDTGWLAGAKINRVKEPGSWEFGYDYRDLQSDAVFGAFTDSDFIGGGTGGRGHRFWAGYGLTNNVVAALTYFDDQYAGQNDNTDYKRLQADIVLKF